MTVDEMGDRMTMREYVRHRAFHDLEWADKVEATEKGARPVVVIESTNGT